mgnify:CR=1 FL=1
MTIPKSPSWQTRTEGMKEAEILAMLQNTPTKRLLSSLRGFPHVLREIAKESNLKEDDKGDMLWVADRLKLIVIVLEQQWEIEITENLKIENTEGKK